MNKLLESKVFGMYMTQIFSPIYLIAVGFAPEVIKSIGINWKKLNEPILITSEAETEVKKIGASELERIFDLLYGLGLRTIRSRWITAEVDRITALIYFVIVITVFIFAIYFISDFINIFVKAFNNNEFVRPGMYVLASLALSGVSMILVIRIITLQSKTTIAFRYLTALETIKTDGINFMNPIQNIERYLDSNDWILSGYWLGRVESDYKKFFLAEVEKI